MRNMIALLLCLGVIVLCAYLPDIVSWRQDAKYTDQVQFAAVTDIRLEFTNADRTLKETIAILADNRDAMNIPAELASLKKENVQRLAGKAIVQYQEAGILAGDAQFYIQDTVPVLVYGTGENRNNIFWHVNYMDFTHSYYANFTIDDRTGAVVSAESGRMDGEEYTREDMEYILAAFSEGYLKGLGEEFREYDAGQLLEQVKTANDGSYIADSVSFFVEDYRQTSITFFVGKTGFYTYIS